MNSLTAQWQYYFQPSQLNCTSMCDTCLCWLASSSYNKVFSLIPLQLFHNNFSYLDRSCIGTVPSMVAFVQRLSSVICKNQIFIVVSLHLCTATATSNSMKEAVKNNRRLNTEWQVRVMQNVCRDLDCSVGKIKKDMRVKGGFLPVLEKHLTFLFALSNLI